jgi:SPP1 gp7 family putative phage head morphogenesis protein
VPLIYETNLRAAMYGMLEARKETGKLTLTNWTDLPFNEAIDFFRAKRIVSPSQFKKLSDTYKRKAFTVAGTHHLYALEHAKERIAQSLELGVAQEAFVNELSDLWSTWGLAETNDYHLENVFRTNVLGSYQEGRYEQLDATKEDRPFWVYRTVGDSRVREEHAVMDGYTARADDPIWDSWFPPNGFQCRCTIESFTEDEFTNDEMTLSEPRDVEPDEGFRGSPRLESAVTSAIEAVDRQWRKLDAWEPPQESNTEGEVFRSLGALVEPVASRFAQWFTATKLTADELAAIEEPTVVGSVWQRLGRGVVEVRAPVHTIFLDSGRQLVQRVANEPLTRRLAPRVFLDPIVRPNIVGGLSYQWLEHQGKALGMHATLVYRTSEREAARAVANVSLALESAHGAPLKHAEDAVPIIVRGFKGDLPGYRNAVAQIEKKSGRQLTQLALSGQGEAVRITEQAANVYTRRR